MWVSQSFLPVYGSLCFLGCKVAWLSGKGVSLCLSDPCPAPRRSFVDTDSSGKVLTPVSRAAVSLAAFLHHGFPLITWEPQPDAASTPLGLPSLLHSGDPQMSITPTPLTQSHHPVLSHTRNKPTNDLITHFAVSLESTRVTFSFLRALNFFRQSTVSCLCMHDATVARCWEERDPAQSRRRGGRGSPSPALTNMHTCAVSCGRGTGQSCLQQQQIKL